MSLTLPSELFITSREASKLSGFVSDYITRLCRSGKIAGQQQGRAWLIDRESFEKFLETHAQEKEAQARLLAKAREEEYQAIQAAKRVQTPKRALATLRLNHPLPYFEESTTTPVPLQQSLVAVMATLLIMTGGMYVSNQGVQREVGAIAFLAAQNSVEDISNSVHLVSEVALRAIEQSSTLLAAVGAHDAPDNAANVSVRTITITAIDPDAPETPTRMVYTVGTIEPSELPMEKQESGMVRQSSMVLAAVGAHDVPDNAGSVSAHTITITAIDPETSAVSRMAYGVGSETLEGDTNVLARESAQRSAPPSFSIALRHEETRRSIDAFLTPIVAAQISLGEALIRVSKNIMSGYEKGVYAFASGSSNVPRVAVSGLLYVGDTVLSLTNAAPSGMTYAYHRTYDAALGVIGHAALAYDEGKEELARISADTRSRIARAGEQMRLALQKPPEGKMHSTALVDAADTLAAAGASEGSLMAAVESAAQGASDLLNALFDSAGNALASWLVSREQLPSP